ncbi:hypothetical protein CB1_000444013 [Camelus ferus]|nr:hypothetical protein CB1_000444013 [Camelus ferus]
MLAAVTIRVLPEYQRKYSVKEERPEKIPDLKLLVEKKFLALQNKNSDADFQNNEKFVQFKQQLKELKKQYISDFMESSRRSTQYTSVMWDLQRSFNLERDT